MENVYTSIYTYTMTYTHIDLIYQEIDLLRKNLVFENLLMELNTQKSPNLTKTKNKKDIHL